MEVGAEQAGHVVPVGGGDARVGVPGQGLDRGGMHLGGSFGLFVGRLIGDARGIVEPGGGTDPPPCALAVPVARSPCPPAAAKAAIQPAADVPTTSADDEGRPADRPERPSRVPRRARSR